MQSKLIISFSFVATLAATLGAGCGPKATSPKKSNNRAELSKNFLSRGELPAARREAELAIKFNPQNAEAYMVMGLVDFMEALNNYKLLEVDSCLTGIDAEGLREEMDMHLASSESYFGKAYSADKEYSEAYANHAQALSLRGDYPESIRLFEKALEVPHRLINLGVTRANLGWVRFESNDAVGAAKDLRQALQFNGNMCLAKYRMGRVYFQREEWNKAFEQFQAVVDDSCPLQEAHLYFIRTKRKLLMTEENSTQVSESDIASCVALAPKSCVSAQCQAGL